MCVCAHVTSASQQSAPERDCVLGSAPRGSQRRRRGQERSRTSSSSERGGSNNGWIVRDICVICSPVLLNRASLFGTNEKCCSSPLAQFKSCISSVLKSTFYSFPLFCRLTPISPFPLDPRPVSCENERSSSARKQCTAYSIQHTPIKHTPIKHKPYTI
jgi:hypothetical protein